jgi:hypothetical protein
MRYALCAFAGIWLGFGLGIPFGIYLWALTDVKQPTVSSPTKPLTNPRTLPRSDFGESYAGQRSAVRPDRNDSPKR